MNVQAAEMKVNWLAARDSVRAYRSALKENRATRDDKMLLRALRAVMRGKKVLDINLAIGAAGLDAHGRPKLAVCRADATWCHVHAWSSTALTFTSREFSWERRRRGEVDIQRSAFAPGSPANSLSARAQVPSIPPQFRPEQNLAEFHLLWEAEWQPRPPVDPMLLKHVDGPFFVVLACWDLSPLEQAVLRQRL